MTVLERSSEGRRSLAQGGWAAHMDAEPDAGRFLAWPDVRDMAGLSRTTAWRLMRKGEFPSPYRLSPGRVAYSEVELEAWKRWRIALRARRDGAAARSAQVVAFQPPELRSAEPQGPTPPAPRPGPSHRSPTKAAASVPPTAQDAPSTEPPFAARPDLFSTMESTTDQGRPTTGPDATAVTSARLARRPGSNGADHPGAGLATPACAPPLAVSSAPQPEITSTRGAQVIPLARRRTRPRAVHPDQIGFGF